jgi:serine phosphatase RsbU (regulator of sigma subunit)
MRPGKEFSEAVIRNLGLKSRILSIIFFCIFCVQSVAISTMLVRYNISSVINPFYLWLPPLVIVSAFVIENYFYRSAKKMLTDPASVKFDLVKFSYLVTLVEISFPSTTIITAAGFIKADFFRESGLNLLNSPPLIMYFIMIILNSLSLDFRLCVFSGFLAGLQYFLLSVYFKFEGDSGMILANIILKSILILVCGIITGMVSRRIREAVSQSLEAKEALITKLDQLVNEKTTEIVSQKNEIERKSHELEEKNKDVLASITYARRIQRALLPEECNLKGHFAELMILYKPKDIVSGDFYWASETPDGIFFCVADCTGHGVPGAFMSLLNISKLDETVNEKKILRPDLILNTVRKEIIHALESSGNTGMQDGMDCSLILYNKKTRKLSAACANNPFWILAEGLVSENNFDKFPVGKSPAEEKPFTLTEMILKGSEQLYFFTDGYADQFGGPKGKKFKYKQLQTFIADISSRSFTEQKNLLEEKIKSWMGDLEQVDDILISGVKI